MFKVAESVELYLATDSTFCSQQFLKEFRLGYLVTVVSDLSGYVHSNGVYAAKLHALFLTFVNALSL